MIDLQIIHTALDSLKKELGIEGEWTNASANGLDGHLTLQIGSLKVDFDVEIRKELRINMVFQIEELKQKYASLMLVVYRLTPEVKAQLRKLDIAFFEACGNLYFNTPQHLVWIDSFTSFKIEQDVRNRAFTKTGLKVVFEFLENPELLQETYRVIAEKTGTSIGNITHILNSLKQEKDIIALDKSTWIINDYQRLLDKWAFAYQRNLKSTLEIGRFRFLHVEDFVNWEQINLLDSESYWGGEAAGNKLTHYLNPQELTIYTNESRGELMKRYKIVPDLNGNICVVKTFWKQLQPNDIVSPILAYTDLINQNDRRCADTARKIYEKYLHHKIKPNQTKP